MNPALPKMYYVYILRSEKTEWLYIGCTSNLYKRLAEHNNGKSFATKRYKPFHILYYEAYSSKTDAFHREKMLKQHGSSLGKLKIRIKHSLKGRAG